MDNKTDILEEIEAKKQEIKDKREEITRIEDDETNFNDYIDEVTPVIEILGMKYNPSMVLKDVDFTVYCCEKNNFDDSAISEIESDISDLEDDIKDLETSLAEEQ